MLSMKSVALRAGAGLLFFHSISMSPALAGDAPHPLIQAADSLFSESGVNLSLPAPQHFSSIPVGIAKGGSQNLNTAGDYSVQVPSLSLDLDRMRRAEGSAVLLTSSEFGRLSRMPDGTWVPLVQDGNSRTVIRETKAADGSMRLVLHSSLRPREVWIFGSTQSSRFSGAGRTTRWFLDRMETAEGAAITFSWDRTGEGSVPRLRSISYGPLQPFEVELQYGEERPVAGPDYSQGYLLANDRFLSTVVVRNREVSEPLFETRFTYASPSDVVSGGRYLRRVLRRDLRQNASAKTPDVHVDICSEAICRPLAMNRRDVRSVTDLNEAYQMRGGLNGNQVKLAKIDGTGLPSLVYVSSDNIYHSPATLTRSSRQGEPFSTVSYRDSRLFGSMPVDGFAPEKTIWGMTDFNGDGREDFWFANEATQSTRITIFYTTEKGEIGKKFRTVTVPYRLQNSHSLKVARLTPGSGPSIVTLDSTGLTVFAWDSTKEDFRTIQHPTERIFEEPNPILKHTDFASRRLRFADLNGDGIDDWVELFPMDADVPLRFYPGKGDGSFGKPVSCAIDGPMGDRDMEFIDLNNDGYLDLLNMKPSLTEPTVYYLNRSGNCFSKVRTPEGRDDTLTVSFTSGKEIGVDRFLMDMNGDGKLEVVANMGSSASTLEYFSPAGTGPEGSTLTGWETSTGKKVTLEHRPVTDFYDPALQGGGWPASYNLKPGIFEGFFVRTARTSEDLRSREEAKRRTEWRYFSPVHHGRENFWGGFAYVDEISVGDASQETSIRRTFNWTGRDPEASVYFTGRGGEWLMDASYRHLSFNRVYVSFLGTTGKDDPLNLRHSTFRRFITQEKHITYGNTQAKNLTLDIVNGYEAKLDEWKTRPDAALAPHRQNQSCNGRLCASTTFAPNHTFEVPSLPGMSFVDDTRPASIQKYSQADGRTRTGLVNFSYSGPLGLVSSQRACASDACSDGARDAVTKYAWDSRGFLASEQTPRGAVTEYVRDSRFPQMVLEKRTRTETRVFAEKWGEWDPLLNPALHTDIQGRSTRSYRTPQGYLVGMDSFPNRDTSAPYLKSRVELDPNGRLIRNRLISGDSSDPERVTEITHNAFGEVTLTRQTGRKPVLQKFWFGPRGFNHRTSLPFLEGEELPGTQERRFDAADRKTWIRKAGGLEATLSYDASDVSVQERDPDTGKSTSKSFRLNGFADVVGVKNELGAEYGFERDAEGRVLTYRDPEGLSRSFEYDLLGRITRVTEKLKNGKVQVLRTADYGPDSLPSLVRAASGAQTVFTWDSLGRPVNRVSTLAGGGDPRSTTWRYDAYTRKPTVIGEQADPVTAVGQVTGVSMTPGVEKHVFYNDRGLPFETLHSLGDGIASAQTFSLITKYTSWGETAWASYPDGYEIRNQFDEAGRLIRVQGRESATATWKNHVEYQNFTAFGAAQNISYGNGTVSTNVFREGLARLDSQTTWDSAGKKILDFQYVMDGFDNVVSLTDSAAGGHSYTFGYDGANQLTSAQGPYGNLGYSYASSGKMLTFEGTSFEFDELNPLRPVRQKDAGGKTIAEFEYDIDGNRTRRNDLQSERDHFYSWDADGKLAAVCEKKACSAGGTPLARYFYDEQGERFLKTDGLSNRAHTMWFGKLFEHREKDRQWVRHIQGGSGTRVASVYSGSGESVRAAALWRRTSGTFQAVLKGDITESALGASLGTHSSGVLRQAPLKIRIAVYGISGLALLTASAGIAFLILQAMRIISRLLSGALTPQVVFRRAGYAGTAAIYAAVTLFSPAVPAFAQDAANEKIVYFHNDIVGSHNAITGKDGKLAEQRILKPFGQEWKAAEGTPRLTSVKVNTFFQGLERDEETGLDVMGARMYDSSIGQFISRDPLFETAVELGIESSNELALYAFAKNNPLKYLDPTGLTAKLLKIAEDPNDYADTTSSTENESGSSHDSLIENEEKWMNQDAVQNSLAESGSQPQLTSQAPADSPTVMDHYSVTVDKMPPGVSPESLLESMMKDLNGTVNNFQFNLMNEFDKKSNPQVGSIYHIDILGFLDGDVVLTQKEENRFVFQTVDGPGPFQHPEFGLREFGFRELGGGRVQIYTEGVSRPGLPKAEFFSSRAQEASWNGLTNGLRDNLYRQGAEIDQQSISNWKVRK